MARLACLATHRLEDVLLDNIERVLCQCSRSCSEGRTSLEEVVFAADGVSIMREALPDGRSARIQGLRPRARM